AVTLTLVLRYASGANRKNHALYMSTEAATSAFHRCGLSALINDASPSSSCRSESQHLRDRQRRLIAKGELKPAPAEPRRPTDRARVAGPEPHATRRIFRAESRLHIAVRAAEIDYVERRHDPSAFPCRPERKAARLQIVAGRDAIRARTIEAEVRLDQV